MKRHPASLLFALLLSAVLPLHAAQENKPVSGAKGGYQVGDRLSQSKSAVPSGGFREVTWDALMPKNWNPEQLMKGIDFTQMSDGDPRAMDALERMKKAWSEAPVEPSLNGARIRIPGFLVPLDTQRGQVKEFLLVPYFGACIHTPPPPANQIIHGFAARPVKGIQMMEPVWVSGTVETAHSETEFGASGYRMKAELVTPYKQ